MNGLVFAVCLFYTSQWKRLVPDSLGVIPEAWTILMHYVTFHHPPEIDPFYHYNALQCYVAHCISWRYPRALQYLTKYILQIIHYLLFALLEPRVRSPKEGVSPFLWLNGKIPASEE